MDSSGIILIILLFVSVLASGLLFLYFRRQSGKLDLVIKEKENELLKTRSSILEFEMEIENHRDLSDVGEGLVVDKGAMFHITHRLGWRGRFYKSV